MLHVTVGALRVVCIALILAILSVLGCSGSSDNGACVRGIGVKAGCTNDVTVGECDTLSGKFYENHSCSDLAYNSI